MKFWPEWSKEDLLSCRYPVGHVTCSYVVILNTYALFKKKKTQNRLSLAAYDCAAAWSTCIEATTFIAIAAKSDMA